MTQTRYLQEMLEEEIDECIYYYKETGAHPTQLIENVYIMLLSIYRNNNDYNNKEQEYMSFMVDNYFKPKYEKKE